MTIILAFKGEITISDTQTKKLLQVRHVEISIIKIADLIQPVNVMYNILEIWCEPRHFSNRRESEAGYA